MKIIDASAIAAVLLDETEADQIQQRVADENLVAPTLLAFEFTNVCVIKARRFPEKREVFEKTLAAFHTLAIELRDVNMSGAFELARRYGLTAYDASYLWLARELGAELVTLDQRLERAAVLP
ncbi:MAG TPA: type II toxin-antitoxin system VapC family toxin [Rhizomicrobium sp.]|jgi:predicted nucleic acid-binding protein|nr:type II toxin-antitoxin system VapC family toxin [Rhizomicrobium sp.]